MDTQRAHRDKTEEDVLEDISYFERQLESLDRTGTSRSLAAAQVYRLLLRQRRQYLNALRDGQPDRWPDYPEE